MTTTDQTRTPLLSEIERLRAENERLRSEATRRLVTPLCGAMSDEDYAEFMHRCYSALLRGESARMDDMLVTDNPYGVPDDNDHSPEAEIARDWQYGWEHQDWVETNADLKRQAIRDRARLRILARKASISVSPHEIEQEIHDLNAEEEAAIAERADEVTTLRARISELETLLHQSREDALTSCAQNYEAMDDETKEMLHQLVNAAGDRLRREQENEMPQKASIGRTVHYQRYGSPGGEHKAEPSPAIITAAGGLTRL